MIRERARIGEALVVKDLVRIMTVRTWKEMIMEIILMLMAMLLMLKWMSMDMKPKLLKIQAHLRI